MEAVSIHEARTLALDDDLCAAPAGRVVVIGCGNPLRGDDAFGPNLVQHLWTRGVPEGVVLVDGGTAGMDVAFKMRDAEHVVIVDAAMTGAAPGTVFCVPGGELEDLPAIDGLHTHQFRWDHALAFGRWLLAEHYPQRVTVYLVETADTTHGAPLSEPVLGVLEQVAGLVRAHYPEATGG
ncbi:MAG TPA: hydrogenase maturation protease [Ilumatobacter sp.]|nr:hydrogenase maturation protease [Ilumatobacter sp.]